MIETSAVHPTFLGVGEKKCGTTWLYECLRHHPEIFMSQKKEIHFFGAKTEAAKELGWYLEHFQKGLGYKAVGEFSPGYLQRPDAAAQIYATVGKIKILVMLRDPVERFISDFKQSIRNGAIPKEISRNLDLNVFSQVVHLNPRMLERGNYYKNLRKFIDLFGSENVCAVIKEDVDNDPLRELEKIYAFLGVDPHYIPAVATKKVSPGIIPKIKFLESARIFSFQALNRSAPQVVGLIRRLRLAELYRRLNSDERPGVFTIEAAVLDRLWSYYQEDARGLEQFLGRELVAWKR